MMLMIAPPGEHDHASRVDAADAGLSQGGRRCGKEDHNRQIHHLSYHNNNTNIVFYPSYLIIGFKKVKMLIETGASIDWRNPGPERGCPEVCVESYSNHYHCHCNRSSPFSFSLSTMCDHQSDSHNFHYHDHIFILLLSYFHRLMIILKPGKSGATTLDCAPLRHDDGQLRCGEYYHD